MNFHAKWLSGYFFVWLENLLKKKRRKKSFHTASSWLGFFVSKQQHTKRKWCIPTMKHSELLLEWLTAVGQMKMAMEHITRFDELVIKTKRNAIKSKTHRNLCRNFTPKVFCWMAAHTRREEASEWGRVQKKRSKTQQECLHKRYYLALKSHKERKTWICNVSAHQRALCE